MSRTIDVNLPRKHYVKFPRRCVVCAASDPNSTFTTFTGTIGWWSWALFASGQSLSVRAPACRGCAWKLHASRALSLTVTITIALLALFFVWPYFEQHVPRGVRRFAMMGVALVCLLPQIIYEVLYPKPFDITAFADSVDYEFKNHDSALDFVELNSDAKWVKLNGEPLKH